MIRMLNIRELAKLLPRLLWGLAAFGLAKVNDGAFDNAGTILEFDGFRFRGGFCGSDWTAGITFVGLGVGRGKDWLLDRIAGR